MGEISTTSGTKLYIGTATLIGSGSPPFEYEDDSYTEVGLIENLGELGDEAPIVTFSVIGEGRVRKKKGARNAGDMAVLCGRDPLEAGQLALDAAEATDFAYNFKLVYSDARNEDYTDSVEYFRALVSSKRTQLNGNDDITKKMYNLAVDSEVDDTPSVASP